MRRRVGPWASVLIRAGRAQRGGVVCPVTALVASRMDSILSGTIQGRKQKITSTSSSRFVFCFGGRGPAFRQHRRYRRFRGDWWFEGDPPATLPLGADQGCVGAGQ